MLKRRKSVTIKILPSNEKILSFCQLGEIRNENIFQIENIESRYLTCVNFTNCIIMNYCANS